MIQGFLILKLQNKSELPKLPLQPVRLENHILDLSLLFILDLNKILGSETGESAEH